MKHKVLSFPNEVYGVTLPGLQFLEESHISYRRATDDSPTHRNFLSEYKKILKERFQQEDIWITVQYIDVI